MEQKSALPRILSIVFTIISVAACVFAGVTFKECITTDGLEGLALIILIPLFFISVCVNLISCVLGIIFASKGLRSLNRAEKATSTVLVVLNILTLIVSVGLLIALIAKNDNPVPISS